MFAYCGLVGNVYVTAKKIILSFQRQPSRGEHTEGLLTLACLEALGLENRVKIHYFFACATGADATTTAGIALSTFTSRYPNEQFPLVSIYNHCHPSNNTAPYFWVGCCNPAASVAKGKSTL